MFFSEFFDQITDLQDLFWIQTNRRLIQDQDFRWSEQCLCKSYSLTVTFGKIFDQTVLYGIQFCGCTYSGYLIFPFRFWDFFQLGGKCKIFFYRHIKIKRRQFRQITDVLFCGFCVFQNVMSVNRNTSVGGSEITGYDIHCGGFAGTVWT